MLLIMWGSVGHVINSDNALRDHIIPYEQDHKVQFRHFIIFISLALYFFFFVRTDSGSTALYNKIKT
jgi:hypothetical protein